jgi:membrane protein DedA with SNARE-associated domain
MSSIIEIGLLLVFAAIKFLFAAGYLLIDKGYPYFQTVLILIAGGTIGVFVFYYFSAWVNQFINRLIKRNKPRKVFTKQNRMIVKIKTKYGIYGIAFLMPIFFSIPIGSFLAARFYSKKKTTVPILILAVVFWSFVLPLVKLYW